MAAFTIILFFPYKQGFWQVWRQQARGDRDVPDEGDQQGAEAADGLVHSAQRQGGHVAPSHVAMLAMLPLVMLSARMSHLSSPQVVAVEGDFDDCQRLVKSMFAEEEMKALLRYFCILHFAFCLLIVIP